MHAHMRMCRHTHEALLHIDTPAPVPTSNMAPNGEWELEGVAGAEPRSLPPKTHHRLVLAQALCLWPGLQPWTPGDPRRGGAAPIRSLL